jgi:hypothetical protein
MGRTDRPSQLMMFYSLDAEQKKKKKEKNMAQGQLVTRQSNFQKQ